MPHGEKRRPIGKGLAGRTESDLTEIVSAIGTTRLWNGREYDAETGLYDYRTRYLDPATGRFTTRDTIGIWGDPANMGNGYTYVGNNPWTHLDPYGLEGWRAQAKKDRDAFRSYYEQFVSPKSASAFM